MARTKLWHIEGGLKDFIGYVEEYHAHIEALKEQEESLKTAYLEILRGRIGERGPIRPQGSNGGKGDVGPCGPRGQTGPVGPEDLQGIQGISATNSAADVIMASAVNFEAKMGVAEWIPLPSAVLH